MNGKNCPNVETEDFSFIKLEKLIQNNCIGFNLKVIINYTIDKLKLLSTLN